MGIIKSIVSDGAGHDKKYIERLDERIQELNEKIKRKDALLDCYKKNIELKEKRIEQLKEFTEQLLAANNQLQDDLDKQNEKRKF